MTYLLGKSLDSIVWRIKASRQVHWRYAQQGKGASKGKRWNEEMAEGSAG